jgi:hypothetical protein
MLGAVTLLFDGLPAQGCNVTVDGIDCQNVPSTVQTVSFRSDQGESMLDIQLTDYECEETHPQCQK